VELCDEYWIESSCVALMSVFSWSDFQISQYILFGVLMK